jgi:hypothetical protein
MALLQSPLARKALIYTTATLACVGVFMLYTQPDVLVTLAQQFWACF